MSTEAISNLSTRRAVTELKINEYKEDAYFKDNLEHLEYLEYISRLKLIIAALRGNCKEIENYIDKLLADKPDFEFQANFSENPTIGNLSEILFKIEEETDQKVHNSIMKGINLNFEKLCKNYGLDRFERSIVMLFFANNTGKKFRDLYSLSKIDPHNRQDGGMSVGVILSMLWPNYKDQVINRQYFSTSASLLKKNIIITWGSFDETTNILDESLYLHERIVRFILGDDNVYDNDFSCVSRIESSVKMDQVILSEKLKKDIYNLAHNYINPEIQDNFSSINDFYGYGTGMIFFFYGPSGTGKTMLSYALANALGKNLLMMNAERASDAQISFDRLLKHIFMEAKLCNGIVFFDECDDIFLANTRESRDLLIEIENAECITILATNKAIELDPALDRRITLKVPFRLPDSEQREKIWKTLLPPNVRISKDVDFKKLSKNYIFSGGHIKNALFLAITSVMNKNGGSIITLTSEDIENAAKHQAVSIFDLNGFGEFYSPRKSIEDLTVKTSTKGILERVASSYNKMRDKNSGINILIESSNIQTGIDCVEAVACDVNLKIKKFLLKDIILGGNKSEEIKDPVSQKKVSLMEYALGVTVGHRSSVLFVDYDGLFNSFISDQKSDWKKEFLFFSDSLRNYEGLLFIVTKQIHSKLIPFEFDHYLKIDPPPEELQIRKWERNLRGFDLSENDILDLVDQYPLHLNEIDLLSKRALLSSYLNHGTELITIDSIFDVIDRYKNVRHIDMLFGE